MDEEVIIRLISVALLLFVVSVAALIWMRCKDSYDRYQIERRHYLKMKALAEKRHSVGSGEDGPPQEERHAFSLLMPL